VSIFTFSFFHPYPSIIITLSLHFIHISFSKEPKRNDNATQQRSMAKSPETELPLKAFGWAARDTSGTLSPFHFSRRFFSFSFLLGLYNFYVIKFSFLFFLGKMVMMM